MDNPNYYNPAVPNFDKLQPVDDDLDKPIPLDLDEPIPLSGPGPEKGNVSHTPLNLGGPPAAPARQTPAAPTRQAPAAPARQAPAAPARQAPSAHGGAATPAAPVAQIQMPKGAVKPTAAKVVSSERITGVKTFFTKLHPGALEFLDEQICAWLKKNPGVFVKRTNITTGDIQSKKTEPNIIITIWY